MTGMGGRDRDLPDVAFAASIAMLGDMTPVRLSRILGDDAAASVYDRVLALDRSLALRLLGDPRSRAGKAGPDRAERITRSVEMLRRWSEELARRSAGRSWAAIVGQGVKVLRRGGVGYPPRLGRLRLPPELLWVRGDSEAMRHPSVAVVGTRRATYYGKDVAHELGRDLTARGIAVVSGLASGIDASAHFGALVGFGAVGTVAPAPPLGVAGGGVDVVYPAAHRRLYDDVSAAGAVVSEAPLSAPPSAWRFPLRNRIIAGLSHVLIVVESSRQGGAMHTVDAADEIDVPVLAVPGSIRSDRSDGTNLLLREGGATVLTDVLDVAAALELALAGACDDTLFELPSTASTRRASQHLERQAALIEARCSAFERHVLDALEPSTTPVDRICLRLDAEVGEVVKALTRLEELGLASPDGLGWVRV